MGCTEAENRRLWASCPKRISEGPLGPCPRPSTSPEMLAPGRVQTCRRRRRPIHVNTYFSRHPEMMLGQMRLEHGMYRGGEPTLVGELSQANLGRAIGSFRDSVYVARDAGARPRAD